jgi:hypothetical protein
MPGGLHFVEDMMDLSIRPDHKRHARNAFEDSPIHGFVFNHAEGIADFLVGIGKQRVGEMVLVLKLFLFFDGIGGNTEDYGARLLDLAVCVAEPARFFRSAGSVGFGIEKKHHSFAPKIFQGNFFAVLVRRTEVGGFIIDFHGILSSSVPHLVISHHAARRHLA